MTTIDSITKLEIASCPFCGGPASVEELGSAVTRTDAVSFSVGCDADEANCPGYQSLTTFSRRSDAVAAWNRRAHLYVRDHWAELRDGDVVDVQFILGETAAPKKSERETAPL